MSGSGPSWWGPSLFAMALAGCDLPCKLSSECERGERCSMAEGGCVAGCRTNTDCDGARAICESSSGLCRLQPGPAPRDAGIGDTGTSSTSDAGIGDTGTSDAGIGDTGTSSTSDAGIGDTGTSSTSDAGGS